MGSVRSHDLRRWEGLPRRFSVMAGSSFAAAGAWPKIFGSIGALHRRGPAVAAAYRLRLFGCVHRVSFEGLFDRNSDLAMCCDSAFFVLRRDVFTFTKSQCSLSKRFSEK